MWSMSCMASCDVNTTAFRPRLVRLQASTSSTSHALHILRDIRGSVCENHTLAASTIFASTILAHTSASVCGITSWRGIPPSSRLLSIEAYIDCI
jgi:hypothetical protein